MKTETPTKIELKMEIKGLRKQNEIYRKALSLIADQPNQLGDRSDRCCWDHRKCWGTADNALRTVNEKEPQGERMKTKLLEGE